MNSAVEDVQFLSRSESRVTVLNAVTERARTRNELKELTDVSRFTLSRTLSDLEDRGWIERAGGQYEATGRGAVVAEEFESLLDNIGVAESLDGALEWLQVEKFDFDLARLESADVVTPTQSDHTAHIRRPAELFKRSDRVQTIATGIAPENVMALREATVEGDLDLSGIIDTASFEALAGNPELAAVIEEILRADHTELFRYDGEDTLVMLIIGDDAVQMCGHDEDGPAPGTIESTDPEVRSWARSYFESIRPDATVVEPEMF